MEIAVLGINHKTAPLELREKLSIPAHRAQDVLKRLEENHIFDERLLLSTCNRTEIYGVMHNGHDSIGDAKKFLSDYAKIKLSDFEDKLYVLRQPHSVEHLFSVASGLNSMVVGETEITGQVKDAYLSAHQNQHTGKVLNNLFQRSLKVAKALRTQTGIGAGKVSAASIAVDLAAKIFQDLSRTRMMVLGSGDMASQLAKVILSKGAQPLIVSSRCYDRAQELAQDLGIGAIAYEDYETQINKIDIILASTSAPHALIQKEQVRGWMKQRHDKPLFLIDISLPRNVEPSVGDLDNVYLYNLDDLQEIAEKNRVLRESQIEECGRLVQTQTQYFMDWLSRSYV